ncbi:MAG: VOC family protein [Candidatus Heimdallarchaeota archaeon]|nr:VOC family protein [Candidatus Heimdallarchaeota archaeon]
MKKFNSIITFLQTDNLKKTTEFYTEVLNCTLIIDQGLCRIFMTAYGSYFGFCSHEFLDKEKNSVCLTFICETKNEVNDWFNHLQKKNIETKDSPKENTKFRIYNFFAKDPNGITIEIQCFLHPFPPEEE